MVNLSFLVAVGATSVFTNTSLRGTVTTTAGVRFLVGAMTTKRGEAGVRDSVSGQISCQDLADHELGLLAQSDVLPSAVSSSMGRTG